MSIEGENESQNPFSRPGFIAAAVVVAVIVVLGIVIAIVNATQNNEPEAAPPPSATPTSSGAPTTGPSAAAGGASICGLDGEELSGTLSTAPEAEWEFQSTTAYPTSPTFGPGETDENGVKYCFQHTPEGALFAAANAAVQGSDAAVSADWIEYFLSNEAPNRAQLLSDAAAGSSSSSRMSVAGFRMLAYDGHSAHVDLAVRAVGSGNTVYASVIYDLVWEAGDWKLLPRDASNPLQLAEVPDLSGYIAWGSDVRSG